MPRTTAVPSLQQALVDHNDSALVIDEGLSDHRNEDDSNEELEHLEY